MSGDPRSAMVLRPPPLTGDREFLGNGKPAHIRDKWSAAPSGKNLEMGKVTHDMEFSGTASMPSVGAIRLAPRPRSRLWRSSGPREVDNGRMLPNPPRPYCNGKNNTRKGSDQLESSCTIHHLAPAARLHSLASNSPRRQVRDRERGSDRLA